MCLAIPAQVEVIEGDQAVVSIGGVRKEVSLALVDDVEIGDFIHTDEIIGPEDKRVGTVAAGEHVMAVLVMPGACVIEGSAGVWGKPYVLADRTGGIGPGAVREAGRVFKIGNARNQLALCVQSVGSELTGKCLECGYIALAAQDIDK